MSVKVTRVAEMWKGKRPVAGLMTEEEGKTKKKAKDQTEGAIKPGR